MQVIMRLDLGNDFTDTTPARKLAEVLRRLIQDLGRYDSAVPLALFDAAGHYVGRLNFRELRRKGGSRG